MTKPVLLTLIILHSVNQFEAENKMRPDSGSGKDNGHRRIWTTAVLMLWYLVQIALIFYYGFECLEFTGAAPV